MKKRWLSWTTLAVVLGVPAVAFAAERLGAGGCCPFCN
jgi:hypothetical protein